MLPRMLAAASAAGVSLLAFSLEASGQSWSRTFGPMGPEIRPSETLLNDQVSCVVARGPNVWAVAWSDGQDVFARRFDLQLRPLGHEFKVNTFFDQDVQDEPELSFGTSGNLLCAWTDLHGYDGSGPGIMARIYDPNGAWITSEFVVTSNTLGSQAHPQIAPTPGGGWVVSWTGDNDGNAYFRILSANGVFLSGDVLVNTYTAGSQGAVSPGVNPNGTIFVAFVDYSSHGGVGTGSNLYGRTFDASGVALQAQEVLLTTAHSDGDQLNPHVAADGLGRFMVVWEDQLGDGSGHSIYERVFDHNGAPYAAEAQVNTTITNDQSAPCVAVDGIGRSVVTWTDFSGGAANPVIRARRYNGQVNPFGPDFVVNEFPAVGTIQSALAMDDSGEDIVIGYQGPGAQGNGIDVYVRQFASTSGPQVYCVAKVNSQGCTPAISFTGYPSASAAIPFNITATNVLNQKIGLMFYGYASSFTPFHGSTICVTPPLKRLPTQHSGGSNGPTDCTGVFSMDFNARIQGGADPGLVVGATISARWYYRDPHDPAGYGTGLTDSLRFAICP